MVMVKNKKDVLLKHVLCEAALKLSEVSANSRCMCIYHQPEKPEALKKLRKF